jgi:hypothetical protein
MKQTAVEWLIKIYLQTNKIDSFDVEQAKALEKQQIMEAVYDSMGTNFDPNIGRAELYYNEKYGK